jgi:CSLREA domain-containing protein
MRTYSLLSIQLLSVLRDRRRFLALGLLSLICLSAFGWQITRNSHAHAARRNVTTLATTFNTITVNTTSDQNGTGANCSLREAIISANTNAAFGGCTAGSPGLDTIVFNLSVVVPPTISIGSTGSGPLPDITEPVVIDGSSDGRVELDGTSAGNSADGLKLSLFSGGSTFRSLVINRFQGTAIRLTDSSNNSVQNCYLGIDATGSIAQSNAQYGIHISGGGSNVIGGTATSARNVISNGIYLESTSNNQVLGNYIGTDASGTTAVGNGGSVTVSGSSTSSNNLIGGTSPEARNVISGNINYGVYLASAAVGNRVLGNYIGTSADGLTTLGNGAAGVLIESGQNNEIGGMEPGAGNLISGNAQSGIHVVSIAGTVASGNRIEGNRIGTNVNGTAALPNGTNGVSLLGAINTLVGGPNQGAGNLISGNGTIGVYVRNNGGSLMATGNRIEGNYIGTDASGSAAIANGQDGVRIESHSNFVGGATTNARNLISGNTQHGIFLTGQFANANQIQGNYIGTKADGQTALGNGLDGIPIVSGSNNLIGGSTPGTGNLISGNGRYGVLIQGVANANKLEGNYIGTNASGATAIANGQSGVLIESTFNFVGGTQTGTGNVISGNALHGIHLNGATANVNSIQGNFIGLTADGLSALAPIELGKYGVHVSNGATNNTIGGNTLETRNVVGGYNVGVNIESNVNFVSGNYIGTDFTGLNAVPNTVGVYIFRASNNIIGGSSAGTGNLISGNQNAGIVLNGAGASAIENSVAGNLIGLTADGLSALGNRIGIDVLSASLTNIGGVSVAERNIISGNFIGIGIRSNNTQVHGNYIGTNLNGTAAVPNTLDGIYLDTGTTNYIGGITAEEGNVISGNGRHGIFVTDLTSGSTTGNQIWKNRIGTDASGLAPLGNTLDGVHISKSSDNFVGESPDLGNVIAFNGRNGVTIASAGIVVNGIFNNAIHSSGALGIDLAPLDGSGNPIFGVTANDSGDGDSGPNGLTNFPVLTNATAYPFGAGMRLAIQGSLDAPSNSKVQFFRSSACDPAGNGEGQTFLGEISLVYTGSAMNFNQTLTLPAGVILNAGDAITATATSSLGTSEFSVCIPVGIPMLTINDISVTEGNSGTTNATFTVTLSNAQGAPGPITVNYDTTNGTATAPSDYITASGTLTFNAPFTQNTITQTITVSVIGDGAVETNETFLVNLTSNLGASLIDSQGVATM